MATFNTARLYDKKVICPYDNAHVLTVITISKHLIKCAKRHPEVVLEKCPFNATHRIKASDYAQHMLECDDRDVVDAQLVQRDRTDKLRGNLAVPSYDVEPTVEVEDENWENDTNTTAVTGFDQYSKGESIFMDVNGHTPTSKKERLKLYKKLFPNYKEDEEKINKVIIKNSPPDQPKPTVTKSPHVVKQIRRPNKEGVADMINKEYMGLGRGLRRCAATFTGVVDTDTSSLTHTHPFKPVQNTNQMIIPNHIGSMGRGLLAHSRDRNEEIKKPVGVPPGFESHVILLKQNEENDDTVIQEPLEDGKVCDTPSKQAVSDSVKNQFNDVELEPKTSQT